MTDGGPAFPSATMSRTQLADGMSLRDYFAAHALGGIKLKANDEKIDINDVPPFASQVAMIAYAVADAMLAAGGKLPS